MQKSRWGVVGLGRAGQARLRAIAARPHLELAGTVGRRPGRGTTTFDALLADPTVDGVVVCSENAHHPVAARRALEAGKHVIVEFPLAPDPETGRALYALAAARGRVLHMEHIGLLTARHRAARAVCRAEAVHGLDVRFTGGLYRWVADEARAGRQGNLALGRLHALHDLVGPLTLVSARCDRDDAGYRLRVRLEGASGARVVLTETRGPDLKRSSTMRGELADGRPFAPQPEPEPGDLFGRDFDAAVQRIAGAVTPPYLPDATVLTVLELAHRIDRAITDP